MLSLVVLSVCLLLGASFAQGPGSLCSPNVLRELAVPAAATNTGYTCQSTLFYKLRLTSSAAVSVFLEDALAPTHNRIVMFPANAGGTIFAPVPSLDVTPANDTEGTDSLTAQLDAGDYYIGVAVTLEFFTPPPDAVPFTLSVTVDPASARGAPSTAIPSATVSLSAPMTLPADGTASVSFTASTYEFIIYALVALPNVRADLYDASGVLVYYNGDIQLNQLLDPPGFAIAPGSYSIVMHGNAGNSIRVAISRVYFDCSPTADLPPMQSTPGLSDLLVDRSLTRDITLPFTETFGVCTAPPRPFYSPVGPNRRWFHFVLSEESSVTLRAVTSKGLPFDAAIGRDVNSTTSGLYTVDLPYLFPTASNRTSATAVLTPGPYFLAFGGYDVDPAVTLSVVAIPTSSASATSSTSSVSSMSSVTRSTSVSAGTSKAASTSSAATTATTGTGSQFPTGGSVPGSGFTAPPQLTTRHPVTERPSVAPSATPHSTPTQQTQSNLPTQQSDVTATPTKPGPDFASDALTNAGIGGCVLFSILAALML